MLEEKIEITNKLEELHKVNALLEGLEDTWGLPMPIVMNLNLCLEEALTNVIFYAYQDSGKHSINISIQYVDDKVNLLIKDEGKPFNPLEEAKEPDTEANVEDRQIGGLGVFFIKQFMDEVKYQRVGDFNQLNMIKQL